MVYGVRYESRSVAMILLLSVCAVAKASHVEHVNAQLDCRIAVMGFFPAEYKLCCAKVKVFACRSIASISLNRQNENIYIFTMHRNEAFMFPPTGEIQARPL